MELKPCPFCGSHNVKLMITDEDKLSDCFHVDIPFAAVECFNCKAVAGFRSVQNGNRGLAKIFAARDWNRRADNV